MSIGNIHNTVRRGHQDAVVVIGFLAIPKSESCIIKLAYLRTDITYLSSDQRTFLGSGISNVPPPTISQLTVCDPAKPKAGDDDTRNCSLWRRTLPKDNIWAWPIHS